MKIEFVHPTTHREAKRWKPTKRQRHEVYVMAMRKHRKMIKNHSDLVPFMCTSIRDAFQEIFKRRLTFIKHRFPEFWDQRPTKFSGLPITWFPIDDVRSRMRVLKRCVELTK